MLQDRWNQIKDTFHVVLRLAAGERAKYLDEIGSSDKELRAEVETLVSAYEESKTFLEKPVIGEPPPHKHNWRFKSGDEISHYSIIQPIAVGGMGEVYLADDRNLERQVALKVLPAAVVQDERLLRRFRHEARVISALNHPNILTIFEFGEYEGVQLFAGELVDGVTLREKLKSGPVAVPEAVDIGIQVASALNAAHIAGVIHRDIKPENIMVRNDGYVKVLDFGLAKLAEAEKHDNVVKATSSIFSEPGLVMGTVTYMSPEQTRGVLIDTRSDIFSLGIVLYEMLAGRPPFTGDNVVDVIASILQTEPESLSELRKDIDPDLDRIILTALQKEKFDRYPTAISLLQDLTDFKMRLEIRRVTGQTLSSDLS